MKWDKISKEMYELWLEGKTFNEIGKLFNISKQRVAQLFNKYFPTRGKYTHAGTVSTLPLKLNDLDRSQRLKFSRKKQNAKKTGYEWTILFQEIKFPTHCPILGLELDYFAESTQENSPSFDRLDPSLGYIKGNVYILSWRANRIKNDGTADEHEKIAIYLKTKEKS